MCAHFSRYYLMAGLLLLGVVRGAQAPIIPEGAMVTLPPLIVEETKVPIQWRYFASPQLEVLSATTDTAANAIVERAWELDQMLGALVPARFLTGQGGAREKLILLNETSTPAPSRELLDEAPKRAGGRVRFLPNLALTDRDLAVTLAMTGKDMGAFAYSEERIAGMLANHRPRPPEWLLTGVHGLYTHLVFLPRRIGVTPLEWNSPAETEALRAGTPTPRTLLRIDEMLATRPEKPRTGSMATLWRNQCTLFLHWALLADDGAHREALWALVDRLAGEPLSEEMFFELFGLGYADMRDQLSDYLPGVVQRQSVVDVDWPDNGRWTPVKFRDATDVEVARIRGDLERLEANYVRSFAPAMVDTYLNQARRTVNRVVDTGNRDPQLLAVAGLIELDGGEPKAAQPLLEAAAKAGVVRPRLYFEIARLRYEAITNATGVTAKPGSPNGKLNPAQVASVMEPLLTAHRQEPPLIEVYALMAEVMSRGTELPNAEQLAALHEGATRFPQVAELVAQAIRLHRAAGQPAAAAALAQVGRMHATTAEARARIESAAGTAKR